MISCEYLIDIKEGICWKSYSLILRAKIRQGIPDVFQIGLGARRYFYVGKKMILSLIKLIRNSKTNGGFNQSFISDVCLFVGLRPRNIADHIKTEDA